MEAARDEEAPKPALVQLLVRAAPAEAERQEVERAEAERLVRKSTHTLRLLRHKL